MRSTGKAVCQATNTKRLFAFSAGLDIRSLVERARELCAKGESEGREKAGRELAKRIGGGLQHQQRKKTTRMDGNGRHWKHCLLYYQFQKGGPKVPEYLNAAETMPSARYVTVLWIILKALNLVVVLVLLQLLTTFLDNSGDQQYWGVAVLQDLWAGRNWRQSGAFPRVCFGMQLEFELLPFTGHLLRLPHPTAPTRLAANPLLAAMRSHGWPSNINKHLSCLLQINMMNEKIFLFCWFWLLGLSIIGTANLLLWLYRGDYFVSPNSCKFPSFQRLSGAPPMSLLPPSWSAQN